MSPRKSYRVLVADPPWKFGDKLPGGGRGAEKHYPCMSTEEIVRFQIPRVADDSLLFLWRVASMPWDALRVAKAWGFEPKSEIVWVKGSVKDGELVPRIGMGRYVRNCHETALVCSRGRGLDVIANHGVPSVFVAPRGKHSAKPDEFRALVDKLCHGPVAELFARTEWPGWDCFGNNVNGRRVAVQESTRVVA